MATIINNPPSDNSGGPVSMIIGLVIVLVLAYLVYVYGIPAIQNMRSGGTQINVPSQIDVNVKNTP